MATYACNPSVRVKSKIVPDYPGQTSYSNLETKFSDGLRLNTKEREQSRKTSAVDMWRMTLLCSIFLLNDTLYP